MKKPVLVFVDFDGVLNTPRTWGVGDGRPDSERIEAPRVKVLDDFCREVGGEVVISSTWRRFDDCETLTALLRSKGLTVPVAGVTPILNARRHVEIVDYIRGECDDEIPADLHFVIFDDDRDAAIDGSFVYVENSAGLTRDHTARAKRLLERCGWRDLQTEQAPRNAVSEAQSEPAR